MLTPYMCINGINLQLISSGQQTVSVIMTYVHTADWMVHTQHSSPHKHSQLEFGSSPQAPEDDVVTIALIISIILMYIITPDNCPTAHRLH